MKLRIIPQEGFTEFAMLEKNLSEFESETKKALNRLHSQIDFSCNWKREGDEYVLDIYYGCEGRLKNWMFKKMLRKAVKKIGLDVEIK